MKSGVAHDYVGVGSAIVMMVSSTLIVSGSTGTPATVTVLPVLEVALIALIC
jgi:hypothetical protein